jgi:hypothetical protein
VRLQGVLLHVAHAHRAAASAWLRDPSLPPGAAVCVRVAGAAAVAAWRALPVGRGVQVADALLGAGPLRTDCYSTVQPCAAADALDSHSARLPAGGLGDVLVRLQRVLKVRTMRACPACGAPCTVAPLPRGGCGLSLCGGRRRSDPGCADCLRAGDVGPAVRSLPRGRRWWPQRCRGTARPSPCTCVAPLRLVLCALA